MEVSSLQEIKLELAELSQKELKELCISLAKYKKDNKEYLGYLLFQAQQKDAFVLQVKSEIDSYFIEIKQLKNLYYVKKSLRKVLRVLSKYSKYMNDKVATADLLIYFCRKIMESKIAIGKSNMLTKLYYAQLKKIDTLVESFHDDLQGDYSGVLDEINSYS